MWCFWSFYSWKDSSSPLMIQAKDSIRNCNHWNTACHFDFHQKAVPFEKRHLRKTNMSHVSLKNCISTVSDQWNYEKMRPFPFTSPFFSVERNRREAALNWLDSRHDQAAKVLETEFPPGVLDGEGDNLEFQSCSIMSHQQKLVVVVDIGGDGILRDFSTKAIGRN